jgi:hypothetical protein
MDIQELQRNEVTLIESVEVLIAKINVAHAEAQAYAGKAIERAIDAGDLLLLAKTKVQHGLWKSWLKEHCPAISIRTAQDYMKVARELPIEKRSAAFLTVREALRLVSGDEPESTSKPVEKKSIDFLPQHGEVARFIDDDWTYMMTESTEHPGYYWLQRWFNERNNDDDKLYRHNEPFDSEYNLAISKMLEKKTTPCDIFRRPMDELGLNIFLKKWKVIDEPWELLGKHDINADVIELMGKNAEAEFVRKTWIPAGKFTMTEMVEA